MRRDQSLSYLTIIAMVLLIARLPTAEVSAWREDRIDRWAVSLVILHDDPYSKGESRNKLLNLRVARSERRDGPVRNFGAIATL